MRSAVGVCREPIGGRHGGPRRRWDQPPTGRRPVGGLLSTERRGPSSRPPAVVWDLSSCRLRQAWRGRRLRAQAAENPLPQHSPSPTDNRPGERPGPKLLSRPEVSTRRSPATTRIVAGQRPLVAIHQTRCVADFLKPSACRGRHADGAEPVSHAAVVTPVTSATGVTGPRDRSATRDIPGTAFRGRRRCPWPG